MPTYRRGTSFWLALAVIPLGLLVAAYILSGALAAAWAIAVVIVLLTVIALVLFFTGR